MRALEIGCGHAPELEGSERLDIRPDVGATYVQSAVDLSNFDRGTFDMVLAKDVVEHLGWREVRPALREWLRVTKPGGTVEVETPNALEVALQIIAPDEPMLARYKSESDWERFCRTTFGHQDYPENTHRSYFTKRWLTDLLIEAGAVSVGTVSWSVERFRLSAVAA